MMRKTIVDILHKGLPLWGLVLGACASMGTPSGGPRDEDAPRLVSTVPSQGARGWRGDRVSFTFDELVTLKDAFQQVMVSPPQATAPRVSSSGRTVYVRMGDTLARGTTYTVSLGASVVDNNEGNAAAPVSLTFSTGGEVDSLRISGVVLDGYDLEPQQNVLVGAIRAVADTLAPLLEREPLQYVCRTDDRGRFSLRGLPQGAFWLYALLDANNDYKRDTPAEPMAFLPRAIRPWAERGEMPDTVYDLRSGKVDTVVMRGYTRFLPNDVLLTVFDQKYKAQYLAGYERGDSARVTLLFGAPAEELPRVRLLGIEPEPRLLMEYNATRDTIGLWVPDLLVASRDTLRMEVRYMGTKDAYTLEARTDTLTLTWKRPKRGAVRDTVMAAPSLRGIMARTEVYARPSLAFAEPLARLDSGGVRLYVMEDTVWREMPRPRLLPDTTSGGRVYGLDMELKGGEKYRLEVDSLAGMGISGLGSAPLRAEFGVKGVDEYARLGLRLSPDTLPGYVEVLNSTGAPVARERVRDGQVRFAYLAPADYYVRFVHDRDSSMTYTAGDYHLLREPEDTYYYPGMLSLKRHDRNETWRLDAVAVDRQKPQKILKNKPAAAKRTRPREEEGEEED